MKTVTLWKAFNPDRLFGGYSWHTEEVRDDWDQVYSDPYEVEIPDDFYIGESMFGKMVFFKRGCNQGYRLIIVENCENGIPYLIGGDSVESIKLRVIRRLKEGD